MRSEIVKGLLKREPFPLLRLHVSNGTTFDVSDPDLVVVTKWTIEFLYDVEGAGAREVIINLLHVIWVEVLPSA